MSAWTPPRDRSAYRARARRDVLLLAAVALASAQLSNLAAPTGLVGDVAGTAVTLSWKGVSGATQYLLRVGRTPQSSDVYVGTVAGTSVTGIAPPGTYYWRVLASNGTVSSPSSAEAQFVVGSSCLPAPAPQNLTSVTSGFRVTLTWSGLGTDYIIEAGAAPGLANLYNAALGSAVTSLSVDAPAGTYYVRVRARNVCGISPPSNERMVVVNSANNAVPVNTSPSCSFSGGPGSVQRCTGSAINPDPGDLLTFRALPGQKPCTWFDVLPHPASNPLSVILQGTVPASFNGTCNIVFQICDQRGACSQWTGSYIWNTTPTGNRPPVITSPGDS